MKDTTNEDFLKQSLLYQMSLGSKELYHSNVWAWLIEKEHKFIKVFFDDFDENAYKVLDISREFLHRDLIIWLQKKSYENKEEKFYYVIENKIKSLPTKEQLQGYTEDLWKNRLLGATFTGIENTLSDNCVHIDNEEKGVSVDWKFVSYETIADKIYSIAEESSQELIQEKLPQIYEYCNIIKAINQVLKKAIALNQHRINYACELDELRLRDVFVKLKGSDFIRFIVQRKSELESMCPKGYDLAIWQSFHNGKATLDIRFTNSICVDRNSDEYLMIGVQIEGYQYRFVVEKNGTYDAQKLYDRFKFEWFDDSLDCYAKERRVFGNKSTMKPRHNKKFDSYKGSNYSMIYQYYDITDDNNSYEQMYVRIKTDLAKAKSVIESGNY